MPEDHEVGNSGMKTLTQQNSAKKKTFPTLKLSKAWIPSKMQWRQQSGLYSFDVYHKNKHGPLLATG